ncbi:MAG: hypothetical protein ACOCW2_02200, partial [Chitinivibrionales bacterium]
RQLIDELKKIVRSCDLVSVFSDYCIVFLLIETSESTAQKVLARLMKNISGLAGENVNWDLKTHFGAKQLDGRGNIEDTISTLIVGDRNKYAWDA